LWNLPSSLPLPLRGSPSGESFSCVLSPPFRNEWRRRHAKRVASWQVFCRGFVLRHLSSRLSALGRRFPCRAKSLLASSRRCYFGSGRFGHLDRKTMLGKLGMLFKVPHAILD